MPRNVAMISLASLISLVSLACGMQPMDPGVDESGESTSESSQSESSESSQSESSDGEGSDSESSGNEGSGSESSGSESSGSETTGEPNDCPSSTDIAGAPALLSSPPDCEIVCPPGWSNPTLPLEVAWTLDLDPVGLQSRGVALLPGAGSSVLAIAGRQAVLPMRMHSISSSGELEWTVEVDEADHVLQGAITDSTGTVYVAVTGYNPMSWAPEGRFVAVSPEGEFQWMTGPQNGVVATMAPRSEGLVALLGPGFIPTFDRYLVSVSSEGVVEWTLQTLDAAMSLGVAPNGDVVVTSGDQYAIYTSQGEPTGTHPQAFDASSLSRARFVDGETLVQSGSMADGEGWQDGLIAWQQLGGPGWFERYHMGDMICDGEVSNGSEVFMDFAALSDGGLVVVGYQAFYNFPDARPWVGHIDAGGDLIAADLGVWAGHAEDVIAVDDGSVLVLINNVNEDMAYQVRKVLLD